jgi:hypothetical protein
MAEHTDRDTGEVPAVLVAVHDEDSEAFDALANGA